MYRSRLEARWAAFFDLLRWSHEYEPVDFGMWSPDFLIQDDDDWRMGTFVEIKPLTSFDSEVWEKISSAAPSYFETRVSHSIFLSQVAPVVCDGWVRVGWIGLGGLEYRAAPAYISWHPYRLFPAFIPKLITFDDAGWYSACGAVAPWARAEVAPYVEHTMALWAQATSVVQWLGKEAQP